MNDRIRRIEYRMEETGRNNEVGPLHVIGYPRSRKDNLMAMNPTAFMKLMAAKARFSANHPKFEAFLKSVLSRPVEEGTVVEFTVTRPGEEPVTANIKVQPSDLELLQELREFMK